MTSFPERQKSSNPKAGDHKINDRKISKTFADRFSAMGAEARLRIMQCLIVSPRTVGEIQKEIGIPWSTLSHHLEKLRNEKLVTTRREGSFLWYRANTEVLREMLGFLGPITNQPHSATLPHAVSEE